MYNFKNVSNGSSISSHLTLIMCGKSDVEVTTLVVKEKISDVTAVCIDEAGFINNIEVIELTEDQFNFGTSPVEPLDYTAIQYNDNNKVPEFNVGQIYFTGLDDTTGKLEAYYTDVITNKKYMVSAQRLPK